MFMAGPNAPSGCHKPTTRRCGRKEIADWVDASPGQSVYLKLDNDRAIGCTACPPAGRGGGQGHHGPEEYRLVPFGVWKVGLSAVMPLLVTAA